MHERKEARPALPAGRQPLLVSYDMRDEARRMHAQWHADVKAWSIADADLGMVPRAMLPVRDRPGLEPPYILINLVPQTSWGRNLRAMMTKDEWRGFARAEVYARTGSMCLICGGRGEEWPVEADEVWRFDDATGVQTLHDVVPLCPACHEVRTAGLATANGRAEDAARHLAWVERITVKAARERIVDAMKVWGRRSRRRWAIDVSMMERRFGLKLEHQDELTDAVNTELIGQSKRRTGRSGPRSVGVDQAVRHMFGRG